MNLNHIEKKQSKINSLHVSPYLYNILNKKGEKKFAMDRVLYHSLWTTSKNYKQWQLATFENILKTGAIFCRNKLEAILSTEEFSKLKNKDCNRNNGEFVSVSVKCDDLNSSYSFYVDNNPSIIIDPNILLLKDFISFEKGIKNNLMLGEYQIRDNISLRYMLGLSLPSLVTETTIKKQMVNRNEKSVLLKEFLTTSLDEFINIHFKDALSYEEILKRFDMPFYLIETSTGYQVTSCVQEIAKIKQLHQKIK